MRDLFPTYTPAVFAAVASTLLSTTARAEDGKAIPSVPASSVAQAAPPLPPPPPPAGAQPAPPPPAAAPPAAPPPPGPATGVQPAPAPVEAAPPPPVAPPPMMAPPMPEPPVAAEAKKETLPPIHVGVGVRVGVGESQKQTQLDTLDVRPYISGQVHKYVKFTANLDSNDPIGAPNFQLIRVLDAIGQFEFDDLFNVWIGRFLPPSDRPNLSGPYYQNSWRFPATSRFPSIYAGRDDGVAVWGQVGGGRFKYQIGTFDGGNPDSLDAWRYAGRLTLNLLDPEPGYYNSSTYYGDKDILALGGVIQYQHDHIYTPAVAATGTVPAVAPVRDEFVAFSLDLLFEKNLNAAGVATLEAEYYNFAEARDGSSFMVLGSYLIPTMIGIGRLQPDVRYQFFAHDTDFGGAKEHIVDAGLNYIIDGHNLRLAANYFNDTFEHGPTVDGVELGVQVQK